MTRSRVTQCVTRTDVVLTADPARVLARLFVPGQELSHDSRSRASGVLGRILALPEDEVGATLSRVRDRYAKRHRDLPGVLAANYERIAHRVPDGAVLSDDRRSLVGAWFTHEYSVEAAADSRSIFFSSALSLSLTTSSTPPAPSRTGTPM